MIADRQVAIALGYDKAEGKAPKVIAKGRGVIAEAIIKIAKEKGIPIQEDTDLADALYQLDLEEEIPEELYQVVAEVLAFIYRMDMSYQKRA